MIAATQAACKPYESRGKRSACGSVCGWFWCDSDGEPVELIEYDGVSEALCRDAALRWLKAQGSVRTSGHACLFLSGNPIYGPGDTVTRYGGETWDAALVAACKAILDARG